MRDEYYHHIDTIPAAPGWQLLIPVSGPDNELYEHFVAEPVLAWVIFQERQERNDALVGVHALPVIPGVVFSDRELEDYPVQSPDGRIHFMESGTYETEAEALNYLNDCNKRERTG